MGSPTKPLRLQIADRIVEVLSAITEGEEYFKTPGMIIRRHLSEREAVAYPVYAVFIGAGTAPEEINGEYVEEFEVSVSGIVQSHTDLVEAMERSIADIRKAVDADARDGSTSGALGTLAIYVRLGASDIGTGENLPSGLEYFEQRFAVQVAGDPFGA